jgi:hypothetical protein
MLTKEMKDWIVDQLAIKVPFPFLKTTLGKWALHLVVNEADAALTSALPAELGAIFGDVEKGLTPEEIAHLKAILPSYLLEKVHSVLLKSVLEQIINVLVDLIIEALHQGKQLA